MPSHVCMDMASADHVHPLRHQTTANDRPCATNAAATMDIDVLILRQVVGQAFLSYAWVSQRRAFSRLHPLIRHLPFCVDLRVGCTAKGNRNTNQDQQQARRAEREDHVDLAEDTHDCL
jgi:hypothetical protein